MLVVRRIRSMIVPVLLALHLSACHHYVTPEGVTPQAYLATEHPDQVRVTLSDGTRQVLGQVSVVQDSLRGFILQSQGGELREGALWVAPLTSIERFEVRNADDVATFGVVTGVVILVGAAALGTAAILVLTSME